MLEGILIADDDAKLRAIMAQWLNDAGFTVLEVSDGDEAIKCCEFLQLKAIVTDMIMLGKDGVEVIQTIKGEYPNIKIIAISGFPKTGNLASTQSLGADAIFEKPIDRNDFVNTVISLTRSHQQTASPA